MAEILLAPENKDLLIIQKQLLPLMPDVAGVMIDPGVSLHYRTKEAVKQLDFVIATVMAKKTLGAREVMIDPRLSQDKPEKVAREVEHYLNHRPNNDRLNDYKPSYLTVSYFANNAVKRVFKENVERFDVQPVCFTTSSRSADEDYRAMGISPTEFAKRSTGVLSEMGYTALICAAVDAYIVKLENPDMKVFATGGVVECNEESQHKRAARISDVAPYVDVFIIGSSVFMADDPVQALKERMVAAS